MSAHIVGNNTLDVIVSWSAKQGLLERMGVKDPNELGQILHDENVRSVNTRYQEETVPDTYQHTPIDEALLEVGVVKNAISDLDYQSCETDDWNTTRANECLAYIECDMLERNPRALKSLHEARHPMVVEAMLAKGHDPNAVLSYADDSYQNTPLHVAKSADIAQALIAGGADVHALNGLGESPLHRRAEWGQREIVEVLIANGADVNALDASGSTPLHATTKWGRFENAEVLVAEGTDPMIKNNAGMTPLDAAVARGLTQTRVVIESAVIARSSWSPGDLSGEHLVPKAQGDAQSHHVQQHTRRL